MPSIARPIDSGDSTPPNCPICAQRAISWGRNIRNGITEANYLCPNEHAWLTKWVAA